MNDAMDDALATLEEICAADISPEDKLDKVLDFHTILWWSSGATPPFSQRNEFSEQTLPTHTGRKAEALPNLLRSILNELVADHRLKEIHPTVATFAFFGMVSIIPYNFFGGF